MKKNVFLTLITPSILSGNLGFIAALIILSIAGWTYITDNQLFYQYLFGQFGIVTALTVAPDSITAWRSTVASNSISYFAITASVSLIAGFALYIGLQTGGRVVREAIAIFKAMRDKDDYSHDVLKEAAVHAALRVVSLVAWIFYWVFFLSTIIPFCILLLQNGINQIYTTQTGWLLCIASLGLLWLCFHVNVVFVRLSLLRLRVLGENGILSDY